MIYLDNAATSFPHPPRVAEEQFRCLQKECGNPGRGSHALSLAAAEKIYACREELAKLFHTPYPQNVIFTMNTTMALNIAIKGLIQRGGHILFSDMEHNAVVRPIRKLEMNGVITASTFPTFPTASARTPKAICASVLEHLRPNTKMLVAAHASNICSAVLPIGAIGKLCRERGILFVVDAAQSAGHLPIDMEKDCIDVLCAPGHKGLLGAQGSGFFILRDGLYADTLIEGGSGFHSMDIQMPQELPERYEAGTLPTPAIAGLCEGVKEVQRIGIEAIHAHEVSLNRQLQERLLQMPDITIYLPQSIGSILLFNANGIPAEQMGQELNKRGFCVRAGLHCAPLAHKTLNTPIGGAVRISPGIFNTPAQIESLANAIWEILREAR